MNAAFHARVRPYKILDLRIAVYLAKIVVSTVTMDLAALDKALQEIVKARAELKKIDYNNPQYDDLEEKLHDMEDDFQDAYGTYLEEVLQKVHDEHCPDSDVLMPIAYLGDGVPVEADKLPGKDVRLTLEVNPLRIYLKLKDKQELVWEGK